MNWQTVDFTKLLKMVSTEIPLKPIRRSFLVALMKPLAKIQSNVLYKMQHDSKVISLEKMLNEYFNVAGYDIQNHQASKKIFISDAPKMNRNYLFLPEENKPVYLGTMYLGAINAVTYTFIVNIPDSYPFVEQKVRAEIDFYRLAGKRYIIQTYTL